MGIQKHVGGFTVALAVIALAGCGKRTDVELEQAHAAIAKNDHLAAVIHLKNVIATRPEAADARFLLGQQFMAQGDPVSASIELRRAQQLGHDPAQVVPLLARAMLASHHFRKLTDELGSVELAVPEAAADLRCSLARAMLQQGRIDEARQEVAAALGQSPQHPRSRLTDALLDAVTGDVAQAMAKVDAVLQAVPGDDEAWQIKGDLMLRTEPDGASALAAFQHALALNPANVYAHAAAVALLLARNDPAAGQRQFEAMQRVAPDHPQTRFYGALLAYQAGQYAKARQIFQQLLKASPDNAVVLLWAGANELALGALVQAETDLAKVVAMSGSARSARRLLAQTYLRMGQPDKAMSALEPLLAQSPPPLEALTLAGQARLMAGDARSADAFFSRAARARPDDPQIRVALALAELSKGNQEPALANLARVAASDPSTQADLALTSALLRRNELDAALRAIDALDRKTPGQPLAPQLRGQVQLIRHEVDAARVSFEQALQRSPAYFPAVAALATIDGQSGRLDAARQRFTDLLKLEPKHVQARLALAEIALQSGADRDEVARLITAAVQADPKDVRSWIRLIDHCLATQDPNAALSATVSALAVLPDRVDLLDRQGRAQLQLGDARQAAVAYSKILGADPRSALGHAGLAEARLAAGDLAGAENSARRAMELAPEALRAQQVAVNVALKRQQPQRAIAVARAMQARHMSEARGFTVEGEIEALQGHWDAAAAAFRKATTKKNPAAAPARLHQTLIQAGNAAAADAFAERWTREHPKDTVFLFYLADAAQARNDLATAERRYRELLALQPQQAQTLNNLAMLTLLQGKPGALALAEQAVKAAPDQPAFLDTLAQAQAAANEPAKAVTTQKSAVSLRPDDPGLRLTLARLLVQTGEKPQAYAELRRLNDLGSGFGQQQEVQALLRRIGR